MTVQNRDLLKIIKRLELIKSLISLEEEDEITAHICKLEQLVLTPELEDIIIYLKEKSYGKAVTAIEVFINQHHNPTIYIDPEIEALRFEAKSLERQMQELSNEKAELEKIIHEFSVRHNQELGELIIKILHYRKEKSKGTLQYEEAENDYEDFYANYEATKDEKVIKLTDEEKKEIKDKYKKAVWLCHPDVVDKSQVEAANKIFAELSTAYEKNDLKRVTEILENLKQGRGFTSKADITNEKQSLLAELERLRLRLKEINEEVSSIKTSDTFKKIINIMDWDVYFSETKRTINETIRIITK